MEYLGLIFGFVLLIKGADWFVDGSSGIAKLLKVPPVIIGLTIVAMGTSAPEASVSITSGLIGKNELALSNVIGSNIFNLLFVIGICALLRRVPGNRDICKRDLPINLLVTVLFLVLVADGMLGTIDAVLLLLLFAGYILWLICAAIQNREIGDTVKPLPLWQCILYIVIGLLGIIWGGDWVVNNASVIATAWGMSENLVGLTIVAIGTSLPELATSLVAAKKGENGLALGNAVGSCIFNLLFILGISSLLSPIAVHFENCVDICVLIAVSAYFAVVYPIRKNMGRVNGALCLLFYLLYTAYILLRNYAAL